jgi:hypothetical protein
MDLSKIKKSNTYCGSIPRSTRQDYIDYFIENQILNSEEELCESDPTIILIHQNWYSSGSAGCVFAAAIASQASKLNVVTEVFSELPNPNKTDQYIDFLNKIINKHKESAAELVHIIFPKIKDIPSLVSLIKQLLCAEGVSLERKHEHYDWYLLEIRVEIISNLLHAWPMILGPFEFFPATRQAPFTEIVVRLKPKSQSTYSKNNNDIGTAHIADIPIMHKYPEKQMNTLWTSTMNRVKLILGDERNNELRAKAKTTVTVPKKHWE